MLVKKRTQEKLDPKQIQKDYLEKVEETYKKKGVVFFDPSENTLNIADDYLSLPMEITEINSKELGEFLNAFTQQKMYLRTLHSRIEILEEEARRAYYEASQSAYVNYSKEKLSETAKERIINYLPEVKNLYYEYLNYKQVSNMLSDNILNIEDAIFMLSREVTRRCGDFQNENRSYNVGRY